MTPPTEIVSVRYMVHDVEESIDFYTRHFGFKLKTGAAPAFADITSSQRSIQDPTRRLVQPPGHLHFYRKGRVPGGVSACRVAGVRAFCAGQARGMPST